MDYRPVGRSGVKVAPICLGTMMFGGATDATEAARIVDSARAAGVNLIDTADVYTDGESERIVGRLIAGDRERWLLQTKVGNTRSGGVNERGLSRLWIQRAVEHSLRRLATDWIDVYVLHRDDDSAPLEETVAALGDLIRLGRIRYFGLSNFRGWRIAAVVETCRRLGVPAPVVCQPHYNALNRMAEVEILPASEHYGLGVIPYSPLARGVLTGKYRLDVPPSAESRAGRADKRLLEVEFRPESIRIAGELAEAAAEAGMSGAQFAINWLLNNRLVTGVLAGPRTLDQWNEYLGALDHRFTPEHEALVDRLVPAGHPSTPGFTDPRDRLDGRRPLVG